MLSHANAFCFLDWCAATFDLRPGDRFGAHAPFHFDLSVFDLYACCRAGGTLVLVGEALGKDPARLKALLSYHVLPASMVSGDVKTANAKTVQGANVALSKAGTFVTVEDAMVQTADIMATNGVVHTVDRVLMPPASR